MSAFIWVEKYRPKTIDECILPESIKKTFSDFLNRGEIPNMLLSGPPGVGKTTVAKALCNQLGVDYYVINGSDEGRFLDTVRNSAKNFASTVSLSSDADIKSSSLTKQTIPQPTYNSSLERLLRNSQETVGLFSPAIIKIKSSNRSTPGVLWSNLASRVRRNLKFKRNSSSGLTGSWTKNGFKVIRKYLLN